MFDAMGDVNTTIPSFEEESPVTSTTAVAIMVAEPPSQFVAYKEKGLAAAPQEDVATPQSSRPSRGGEASPALTAHRPQGVGREGLTGVYCLAHVRAPFLFDGFSGLREARMLGQSCLPCRLSISFDRTASGAILLQ
jgi:hypothetical protein